MAVNSTLRGLSQAAPGAPALEKGLDLLEVLADEPAGLTQKSIADRVGRSVGEIFRMLSVLEQRGYVVRDAPSGQYRLSLQLFDLAHRHPPSRLLLQAAAVEMERLANAIGQSCHLVGLHGDRLLVLAQNQPDQQLMGWSVRVGAGFPLSTIFASGRVLVAFQRAERRIELVARMFERDEAYPLDFNERLDRIAREGFELAPSEVAQGVTDITLPIFDHFGIAVAALTVAVMLRPGSDFEAAALLIPIRDASRAVTRAIGGQMC
jgi:DNA-binding IclR family transcriptional regulator